MSFVRAHGGEVLYQASDNHAFPTPRSWEMASKVMAKTEPGDEKRVAAACIGASMADQLFKYIEIYHKVPVRKIICDGELIDFTRGQSAEPSFIYAAVFAVAAFVIRNEVLEKKHLANIVKFLQSPGLDPEYQILFLRQVWSRRVEVIQQLKPLSEFCELAGNLVNLKVSLYQ